MGRTTTSKSKIRVHKAIETKTDFFYYTFRNILLVGLPLLVISGFILSHSFSHVLADNPNNGSGSSTDSLTFSISSSCTLSSVVDENHNAELHNGTYVSGIGKTTVTTLCNDGNGYSIYANGYSNDAEGNNELINSTNTTFNIPSGLATSGLDSNWAMSLNLVENDTSPTPPTIENDYNGVYGLVPTEWTKVASLPSSATDMSKGSSFTTTYAVYTSSSQNAGTYNGKVKYMLVHPSYKPAVYFMQDVAEWKNTLGMEESVQAIDKRDGKSYWVTRLKDGNIWMTQNLDLCIGCTGTTALTSENTDFSTTASGSGIYNAAGGYTQNNGVYTWTPDAKAVTSSHTISGTSVPDWPNSQTVPYSAEAGDAYYYTSGTTDPETKTTLAQCIANGHTEAECAHYHAGNYYNWSAAIASNNSSGISSNYTQASNSICPKGWRLPVASNSNQSVFEFGDLLYTNYHITSVKYGTNIYDKISYFDDGFNRIRTAPLWFVRSGGIDNTTLVNSGVIGFYWSSTVINSSNAYYLLVSNDGLRPAGSNIRGFGFPVRCIAR